MDFKFYFSLFLRRLHWFMLFFIIGSAIGLTLAKVLPPVYVAQARLLVESEQIPGNLASSTVRTEATEQLQIIQQRILTRNTLIDMANRLNIYETRQQDPRSRISTDDIVGDLRQRISIVTSGGARRGQVEATLVSVQFEDPVASMASTVANELVTLILREDVDMRTSVARNTLEFFEQDVKRLDGDLAELNARILAFKQENQSALPDSLTFRRSQQAASQERLVQIERQITALQDRRTRMVQYFETLEPGQELPGAQLSPEARQLRDLEDELATQLSVLSPTNPKIKLLQARIEGLRTRVETQSTTEAKQEGVEPGKDRITTEYELQLAQIDGELEYLTDQKTQIGLQLENLEETIQATPGNAITLDTLERDYNNLQTQYNRAVANKAQAETGDIIEALRQGQRISIIEQAVVPREPTKPNRGLIAAGGVGGGLAMGLLVVFLLEFLNKGIRRPADLTKALGITPFATLPYYRTRTDRLRRRAIILSVLGFFLVGIPLGLWALDTYVAPLDTIINRISSSIGLAQVLSFNAPAQV